MITCIPESPFNDCQSKSESFSSEILENKNNQNMQILQKSDLSKDEMKLQKLNSEVIHYKSFLSEYNTKEKDYKDNISNKDSKIHQLEISCTKKDEMIESLRKQLEDKNNSETKLKEDHKAETYKLKMKIDYLSKKCFQLN